MIFEQNGGRGRDKDDGGCDQSAGVQHEGDFAEQRMRKQVEDNPPVNKRVVYQS